MRDFFKREGQIGCPLCYGEMFKSETVLQINRSLRERVKF